MNPRAWETWNVILTMLQLANRKVEDNPGNNPVLRSWEVWEGKRHGRTMVYRTMDDLNKEGVTKHFERRIRYEDQFTQPGLMKLMMLVDDIPERNELQRVTKKMLREPIHELYGKLFGAIPEQT